MKNNNILISGAGVSGLALAYWLKRYGFSPTIIERAPSLRTGGFKIDIRGAALEVVKRMQLYDAIIAAKTDIQKAVVVDRHGKQMTEMPADTYDVRISEDLEILRGDLCHLIASELHDVSFIFGDAIQSITQHPDRVDVTFRNNPPRQFDLVIGADGLHSIVRKLVFGDESQFSRALGLCISIFTVPNFLQLDREIIECAAPGKIAILYSAKGDVTAKAAFLFSADVSSLDIDNTMQQKQLLTTAYADTGWQVPNMLNAMHDATDFYFDTIAQIHMQTWYKDRVALLGDAGYCASPVSGQGTSLALVGAYVLAGELAAAKGEYSKAFQQYETNMRDFVAQNQAFGREFASEMTGKDKSKVMTWLREKLMQWLPKKWVDLMAQRQVKRITRAANAIQLRRYQA